MIHIAQLVGGVLGLGIAWAMWKFVDMKEQKAHLKELEEVKKQFNK